MTVLSCSYPLPPPRTPGDPLPPGEGSPGNRKLRRLACAVSRPSSGDHTHTHTQPHDKKSACSMRNLIQDRSGFFFPALIYSIGNDTRHYSHVKANSGDNCFAGARVFAEKQLAKSMSFSLHGGNKIVIFVKVGPFQCQCKSLLNHVCSLAYGQGQPYKSTLGLHRRAHFGFSSKVVLKYTTARF